jgi:hypothetical protein
MTSFLEAELKKLEAERGPDSPAVQHLRNQVHAEQTGKSVQELYITGSVKKEPVMKKETDWWGYIYPTSRGGLGWWTGLRRPDALSLNSKGLIHLTDRGDLFWIAPPAYRQSR